jgi:hypothetical protein
MTAATVRVPQPLAVDAVVSNDVAAKTLVVRLPEAEQGHGRLLWRQAHQQLVAAEESWWRSGPPTLWASSALGVGQVAHAVPGDLQTLRFHFQPGVAAYQQLVSRPGLSAVITVDRETSRFLTVRFHNRSQP